MGMTVREFVDRLSQLRADSKGAEDVPANVSEALASLTASFRREFTPEALKAALAAGAPAPTHLEESLTTTDMLWTSHRGRS